MLEQEVSQTRQAPLGPQIETDEPSDTARDLLPSDMPQPVAYLTWAPNLSIPNSALH
eukprot:CAMPEP_0206614848 /NCGR_PEP_ID=MMETSP0325_2-20121206/57688_1 /ASSEMBLY_ACC=CAM_ASM_000347 /TAXON_ID=2866 /ORGANISM="Crypthecodinium cohnii, Strain Seligo" /LENGTH=56 /DNA_ID=CAMNT_0054135527 /DNA_START=58 /DNA_END=228 /DNA_ORIENTATION=+